MNSTETWIWSCKNEKRDSEMDAQKDSELKSSSFLIPSLILSPVLPVPFILCLDICLLSCGT